MVGRLGVVLLLLGVAVAGAAPAPAGAVPATDSTVTRITVAQNGTATWQVQVRTRLTSDADVDEYEAFQSAFRANETALLDPFRDRMRGVARDAENATGRSMSVGRFGVETGIQTVPRRWGVVTYEFRWTDFARVVPRDEGAALVVGDVFRGQFFLTENDTLAVAGPEGYRVAAADPEPDGLEDGTVRWFGRRSFPEDTPAVRLEPRTATTAAGAGPDGGRPATGGPGRTDATTETVATDSAGGSSLALAGAVLVVGLLAVGAYRYYLRRDGSSDPKPPADRRERPSGATDTDRPREQGAGSTSGSDERGTADAGEKPGGTESASVDPGPVLTDADRVESVLVEADGQLRQSEIVDALEWSKSKTSRVLSDMADEGRIEKLRIGRENVIRLDAGGSDDGADEVE